MKKLSLLEREVREEERRRRKIASERKGRRQRKQRLTCTVRALDKELVGECFAIRVLW